MRKALIYLIVVVVMLSSLFGVVSIAEETGKPVTYAKFTSELTDVGQPRESGVTYTVNPGTAWVYQDDSVSFDRDKKAVKYESTTDNATSWIDLYFDREYKTTGDDYWITVLFQEESDKNFHQNRGYQTLNYSFGVHTTQESKTTWSYSTIDINGEIYKLAYTKISGFAENKPVTGFRIYPRQGTYCFYSAAIYTSEQDALAYAGMLPIHEENEILAYGLYNTETDCKGIKPSGAVPPVDAGTVWGAPESASASFNHDLKGATITSKASQETWGALFFNKPFITNGDDYIIALLYKNDSSATLSSQTKPYLLNGYQFSVHAERESFSYVQVSVNGEEYTIAYLRFSNMPSGKNITGIRAHLRSNQSYTFLAAAVLKNDVAMDELFDMIVTTSKPLDEENGKYAGAQIRTTLVPYRDKAGVIHESDKRQGLRFCFELPNVGETFVHQGYSYEVMEASAMVILKSHLEGKGEMKLDNPAIGDKMMIQSELIEWTDGTQTYKTAYIYNIPEEYKDAVIVVRAFLVCKDDMGETVYFYSGVQEKSLTDVYNSIVESEGAHQLDPDVLRWWNEV